MLSKIHSYRLLFRRFRPLGRIAMFLLSFFAEAWDLLYKDVYNSHDIHNGGGSQGRVTVSRPYVTDNWPTLLWYKPGDVQKSWKLLVGAAKSLPMSDSLR